MDGPLERIRAKAAALLLPPVDPAIAAAAQARAAAKTAMVTALAASRDRVGRTLAGAPWPNPADRSKTVLQADAYDRVKADLAKRTEVAADARGRAELLKSRVGFIKRGLACIGIPIQAARAATKAAADADAAERTLKDARVRHRADLAQAERSGTATADRREAEQTTWEESPAVRAARREEHGNDLVIAALKDGDREIRELLAHEDGLRRAREKLPRDEAERAAAAALAQKENQERRQRIVRPVAARDESAPGGPGRR